METEFHNSCQLLELELLWQAYQQNSNTNGRLISYTIPRVLIINKRCPGVIKDMPDELQEYPTEDIIRILSNLPDFLRESMMRSRLHELCAKDSKTQDEFIDSILDGLSSAKRP